MAIRKFVGLFEIKIFVSENCCRISYILAGKLNFWILQKRFLWIKSDPLVKMTG